MTAWLNKMWVPVSTSVNVLEVTGTGERIDSYARGSASIIVFSVSGESTRVKFDSTTSLASTVSGVLFATHGEPFTYIGETDKVSFCSNTGGSAAQVDFAVFRFLGEDK